jgi:hypothetical protein
MVSENDISGKADLKAGPVVRACFVFLKVSGHLQIHL